MKITLDPNLERALLRSIAVGVCAPSVVDSKELSKKAKAILDAMVFLIKKGAMPPLSPVSIALAANNISGFPKSSAEAYLKSFKEFQTGDEIAIILQAAREKSALVNIINKAGEQLSSGDLDVGALTNSLEKIPIHASSSASLSSRVGNKFSLPPRGFELVSLPEISKATNGLAGIWVIGGEPGLGKSTFALQIALDVARLSHVAFYDIDGTGELYFIDRIRQIYGDNLRHFKQATSRLYYKDSIEDLDGLLASPFFKPPGLIVVDSIQTLPVSLRYNKESMDDWLRRFKGIIQRGYSLLLISEKARSQYGVAELAGYKGTGDIEYSGTLCAHILEDEEDDSLIKFVVVKNRHGPQKGHIVNLIRDDEKCYWFTEEAVRTFTERKKRNGKTGRR